MLTPPYHFSIVAAPITNSPTETRQILYRGSVPANRNLAFVRRLKLKTVIILAKKALKDDDDFIITTKKTAVDVKWVKAESMGEESLGMGRNEVGEVLKVILTPSSYPLYLADCDGISHTTLIIACLRKLQGWHSDSILNEICRFEPDHDELPLVPFITSYLNSQTPSTPEGTLNLPNPPYPDWLWPVPPSSTSFDLNTKSSVPSSSTIPNVSGPTSTPTAPPKERERERTISSSIPLTQNTATSPLPFPHPMAARRHPTMRLNFPVVQPVPSPSVSASAAMPPPTTSTPGSSSATPANPIPSSQKPSLTRVSTRERPSLPTQVPGISSSQSQQVSAGISGHSSLTTDLDSLTLSQTALKAGLKSATTSIIKDSNSGKDSIINSEVSQRSPGLPAGRLPKLISKVSFDDSSPSGNDKPGTVPLMNYSKDIPPTADPCMTISGPVETLNTASIQSTTLVRSPPMQQAEITTTSGDNIVSSPKVMSHPSSPDNSERPSKMEQSTSNQSGQSDKIHDDGQQRDDDEGEMGTHGELNVVESIVNSEVEEDELEDAEEDEEDDDDEEYEDEDEDDDEDLMPTSQYISALDLAGFA